MNTFSGINLYYAVIWDRLHTITLMDVIMFVNIDANIN